MFLQTVDLTAEFKKTNKKNSLNFIIRRPGTKVVNSALQQQVTVMLLEHTGKGAPK